MKLDVVMEDEEKADSVTRFVISLARAASGRRRTRDRCWVLRANPLLKPVNEFEGVNAEAVDAMNVME